MAVIKKIGAMSLAKMYGLISAVMGLVLGILAFFGNVLVPAPGTDVFGGGVVIFIFPVAYGILGFVSGFVAATVYNMFVDKIGGIEVELK